VAPADAAVTVLLIDDSRTQAERIQDCLVRYRVHLLWRATYRAAVRLLRDPDAGQIIDLVLIDQAFDLVPAQDLLGHSEVAGLAGAGDWDVRLHQGLFIMARLSQDMREGRIPGTRMMILTHYARVEIAAQVGLAGYESKRRLLADPYTSLREYLPHLPPAEVDVERRLDRLPAAAGLDGELRGQLREAILGGLDPDEVCAMVRGLAAPLDWRAVGRGLDQLADERRSFPVQRLARALHDAWLPSPEGWLHIRQLEALGPVGAGFEAFRAQIGPPGRARAAVVAVRALPAGSAPTAAGLRRGFELVRAVDPRCRPLRLLERSWTIVGAWLPEPGQPAGATACGLLAAIRHVQDLHARGLAHGSLTPLTTRFCPPLFGAVRCLAGEQDLDRLRRDDRRRLAALGAAVFEDEEAARAAHWADAMEAGDLARAARELPAARPPDPPAYVEFGRGRSAEGDGFRDLLVACLRPDDAILREVGGERPTSPPLDFVVCARGVLSVIEHRARCRDAALEAGARAGAAPDPEAAALVRALVRCRRSADRLAAGVEAGLGLTPGAVRRRAAIVVGDREATPGPAGRGWRAVMTEAEATAELTQRSGGPGAPCGVHMLPHLPRPAPGGAARAGARALHWTTLPLEAGAGVTMRTWSKRWQPDAWRALLGDLAAGGRALRGLPDEERPLPLLDLRAFDCDGFARDLEAEAGEVEVVEYDVGTPADARPLAASTAYATGEQARRRLAAAVLRGLVRWERLGLVYRMDPDGLLCDGRAVYCDLLQGVAVTDAHGSRRQRLGAAACLVLLLSPWPFAWTAPLAGPVPGWSEPPNERSAWGIGAAAVAALLDPDSGAGPLQERLSAAAELLDAAALLDHRFPSWPAGLAADAVR
jgi:hypothetical protein